MALTKALILILVAQRLGVKKKFIFNGTIKKFSLNAMLFKILESIKF